MKQINCLATILAFFVCLAVPFASKAQTLETSEQNAISVQRERLKSSDKEVRRDAIHQLQILKNAVAARAAIAALKDESEIVRASAAKTFAILPDEEAAAALNTVLAKDKSEFVRREAAFALGKAHSKTAVPNLIKALQQDKFLSVRAAAAIALGQIGDARAVAPLSQVLLAPLSKKKKRLTEDEFVRRSAARALGQLRFKGGVPALIAVLQNTANPDDMRREAAFALGIIADKTAVTVLTENLKARDYLLAETAKNALQRIEHSEVITEN